MTKTMEQLAQRYAARWSAGDDGEIEVEPRYGVREQQENEAHLGRLLGVLNRERKRVPRTAEEALAARERIGDAGGVLALAISGPEQEWLALLRSQGFIEAAIEFADRARRFDAKLRSEDILRASRYAWVMFSIQLVSGQPARVTQGIYAFSLLCPYLENFLNHPVIPVGAKMLYIERLAQRLGNPELAPTNVLEENVWKLVGLVEEQYHRGRHPQLYESLEAFLHAQRKSVDLVKEGAPRHETDLLALSLEKGGAPVVTGGYLVVPTLTTAQVAFLFGLGAYLQLVDELRDVRLNRREKIHTVFTQTAVGSRLDGVIGRTLRFGAQVMEGLDAFDAPGLDHLKAFLAHSAELMLVEAAGQAGRLCSRSYRRELETRCPLRFSAMDRARSKLNRQRQQLERLADEILLFS
jgi:hypothetical protein